MMNVPESHDLDEETTPRKAELELSVHIGTHKYSCQ